ncbi:hypothetical protein BJF78_02930 [Pseudonocardia sp. CNS-139]|nr:hypothetical protein BJF78_02930 [Pseudonocardia sp. CNS-139]
MTDRSAPAAGTVLVVSSAEDATADAVEAELRTLGASVIRLDTGDFPTRLRLAVRNDSGRWRGNLRNGSTVLGFDEVASVYYRRPTRFVLPEGLSGGDAAFAATEARLGFGGAFSALPAHWVNHPANIALAEYKPRQLTLAAAVGLSVPRTSITNDIDELHAFANAVGGPVVCKTFSSMILGDGDSAESVFTTVIEPADVDVDQFAATSHLIQEWVPKAFEARVTVVGRTPFAAAIHAESDAAHIDWRADYRAIRYEQIEAPEDVVLGMLRYLAEFGLNYGAFDFVVEPGGTWRFLECNPNGQWLWLEHEAGLPIAAALAELLTSGRQAC